MPGKIHIKHIFPGFSLDRPGLNFRQIDVPQGKNTQRLEQRTRFVMQAEHDGSFEIIPLQGIAPKGLLR